MISWRRKIQVQSTVYQKNEFPTTAEVLLFVRFKLSYLFLLDVAWDQTPGSFFEGIQFFWPPLSPSMTTARLGRGKKIALVHPDLGIGGAERLVVDAALELSARGYEVTPFSNVFLDGFTRFTQQSLSLPLPLPPSN